MPKPILFGIEFFFRTIPFICLFIYKRLRTNFFFFDPELVIINQKLIFIGFRRTNNRKKK